MLLYPKKWLSLEGEVIEPEWERSVRCVIGWIMARPTSEVCDSHPSLPHLALALPHLTYALLLPPFLSLSSPSATTSPRPSTARNSPISSASFSKKASSVARSSSIPPRPTSAACSRRRIAPTLERSGGCRGSRRRGVCGRSCRGGGWRGLSRWGEDEGPSCVFCLCFCSVRSLGHLLFFPFSRSSRPSARLHLLMIVMTCLLFSITLFDPRTARRRESAGRARDDPFVLSEARPQIDQPRALINQSRPNQQNRRAKLNYDGAL